MRKSSFKEIIKKLKDKNNWEFTKPDYDKHTFEDEVIYKDGTIFFLNQTGIAFRDFYNKRELVYEPGFFAYIIVTFYAIRLRRFLKNRKKKGIKNVNK